MADELRQPLRRRRIGDRLKALRPSGLVLASLALAVIAAGAATWLAITPYPDAGEPSVTVKVAPLSDPVETASTTGTKKPADDTVRPGDLAPEDAPAVPQITIVGGGEEASLEHQASQRSLTPAPQRSVTQKGPFGLLPRISRSGQTPFNVYARDVDPEILASNQPKVALLIGGMGLNTSLTLKAISDLPPQVSFAFAPYGSGLQSLVNKARAAGHEAFLQVPMEPFGYPSINPGQRTLLAAPDDAANLGNLMWFMGRFSGYVGITNYMGQRFAASDAALTPVLTEMKKRGLVFVGDGTLSSSALDKASQAVGLDMVHSSRVIDASSNVDDIVASLKALEDSARDGTLVLGTGSGLATTIEAVSGWARNLNAHGIVLVPASSLFRRRSG